MTKVVPHSIESLLELAASGNEVEAFFEALLEHEWQVPAREQIPPLPSAPTEAFANTLVLEDDDHLVVPIFSSIEAATLWAGRELVLRPMRWEKLEGILPAMWWVSLNPGSGHSKDITSWEREMLKQGSTGIQAIIDELTQDAFIEPGIEFRPLNESEYPDVRKSVNDLAESTSEVLAVYLARELDDQSERLFLALDIAEDCAAERKKEILQAFEAHVRPILIGGADLRIVHGSNNRLLYEAAKAGGTPLFNRL